MPGLLENVDPNGLLEYSVVYTDRALNHMSQDFQQVMKDLSTMLKKVYQGDSAVIIPGSGTFAMEAVCRQFANEQDCMIIRNGWFSYRWSQILDQGKIAKSSLVHKASRDDHGYFSPAPIEEVCQSIAEKKPKLVFAPHVETASGMMLSKDYITRLSQATREVGGYLVLDCIASGTEWIDMQEHGVDILISAPQKGWSSSPCAGIVMMNKRALELLQTTESSSFACNLKEWHKIMGAYLDGKHAYYATMPTDSLKNFRNTIQEMSDIGLERLRDAQKELGTEVRKMLEAKGFQSVAKEGFQSDGVIVSYTKDPDIKSGAKFKEMGIQIAAGVPLQCDEPADFQTFRIGLFGLDKLKDVEQAVSRIKKAIQEL